MSNLVKWIGRSREAQRNAGQPWPAITLDQLPYWFGQFGYQGLGYGPAIIQTIQQNRETIAADFTGYINGAYKTNGIVFSVILCRMMLFSEARFQFRRMQNGRPGKLFGTQDLEILERPWPNAVTSDLLTRALLDADLAGNFYCTRTVRKDRRPNDPPMKVGRMRPDWVTIIKGSMDDASLESSWDPSAELVGYIYTPGGPGSGKKPSFYLPQEVAHFAPIPDPLASYRGMSFLQPVLTEVLSDRAMITHKSMYFENGAQPNLVVSMDTGKMNREVFEKWIETFESEHSGAINAYKCLHPDTDVALWNGARCRADEVEVGDLVVSWSGEKPAPGVVVRNDVQPPSPIVTVTTERGRVIKVNDRHPFLVRCSGHLNVSRPEPHWVEAKDLKAGDLLVTGLGWGRPRLQDSVSEEEAWLMGFLVGDGCFVSSSPTVSMKEPALVERVGAMSTLVKLTERPNAPYDYRILGLAEKIRAWRLNGKRAWEKRVPSAVMTGGAAVVGAFLSGLIDADGDVTQSDRGSQVGITSTSRALLQDVQHLLASMGVNASLCAPPSMRVGHPGGSSGAPRRHDAFRLLIFGSVQAQRLSEFLKLTHPGKAERLACHAARRSKQDRSRVDRVQSVVISEPEPTIGLQVDPHHTHVTGGVVTRNTLYLGMGADVKAIGSNLRDLDYGNVMGQTELRIAAAGGVHPVILGIDKGLQASSLNNFANARRLMADRTLRPLWRNFCASMETIINVPPGSQLWYDDRDIPFLKEDASDQADVQLTTATAMRLLVDAGFDPDSIVKAVENNDFSMLEHTGLYSVQLQPPGTHAGVPDPQTVFPGSNVPGAQAPNNGQGGGTKPPAGPVPGAPGNALPGGKAASADRRAKLLDKVVDVQELAQALIAAKASDSDAD